MQKSRPFLIIKIKGIVHPQNENVVIINSLTLKSLHIYKFILSDYQHSSKYLLVQKKKETHTCLERE